MCVQITKEDKRFLASSLNMLKKLRIKHISRRINKPNHDFSYRESNIMIQEVMYGERNLKSNFQFYFGVKRERVWCVIMWEIR